MEYTDGDMKAIKDIINNIANTIEKCENRIKRCKEELAVMIFEKNNMEDRYIEQVKDYMPEEQIIFNLEFVKNVSKEIIINMPMMLREMAELERGIKYKNYEINVLLNKKEEINYKMDRKMELLLVIMPFIILFLFILCYFITIFYISYYLYH
jgi:hypothetical protein